MFIITWPEAGMAALIILSGLMALFCGWKKSKAIKTNDRPTAALFETLERVFVALIVAFIIGLALICAQDVMANGFSKILTELEALKHG